jgi:F0F1-type ATP synthase beta subunit
MAAPGPDAGVYLERHAAYRALYPALSPLFPAD